MIRQDLGAALRDWSVAIDSNGLRWPASSSRPDAYVTAEGGAVCTVHLCENPRRALAGGADIPDTRENALAAEIRDARACLISAAPDLLAALRYALRFCAPSADLSICHRAIDKAEGKR